MYTSTKFNSKSKLILNNAILTKLLNDNMMLYRQKTSKGNDQIDDNQIPPEPTNCCMSGCANCVWIQYAEQLVKIFGDSGERTRKIILDKVTDPNMKAFLSMELRNLESKISDPLKPK